MGGGIILLVYKLKFELFKKMVYIVFMNKILLVLVDDYRKDYFFKIFDDFLMFLKLLYYDISIFILNSKWMKNVKKNFDVNDYNNEIIVKFGELLLVLELYN